MAYEDSDKVMDVETLIAHVRKAGGYLEEEENGKLVPVNESHAACLYLGSENLGAFIIPKGVRICIRPFYYDDYEEAAVATKKTHGVPLAYEHLDTEQRVILFNQDSASFYEKGKAKGYNLRAPFEIKELKAFKVKNAESLKPTV